MANYGSPGGGNPEPWREPWPGETYGPVAEPGEAYGGAYGPAAERGRGGWDQPDPSYGAGSYRPADQPHVPYQDLGPAPYAGRAPRRRKRARGPMIAVLAAVLLFVLVGAALSLLGQDDDTSTPVSAPSQEAPVAEPGTEETPEGPAPESSADPRFVKVGQCVRNDAPAGDRPKLLISECAPKTYEVLHRFDRPTSGEKDAETKCAQVEGYTNWYFFDSDLDSLDFVLCLKQR